MRILTKCVLVVVIAFASSAMQRETFAASCDPIEEALLCEQYHQSWLQDNQNSCAYWGLSFSESLFYCYYDENGCYAGYYGEGWCVEW